MSIIFKNKLDKACFQHDMLMEILKTLKEEHSQIKSLKTKPFKFQAIQNTIDIKED